MACRGLSNIFTFLLNFVHLEFVELSFCCWAPSALSLCHFSSVRCGVEHNL